MTYRFFKEFIHRPMMRTRQSPLVKIIKKIDEIFFLGIIKKNYKKFIMIPRIQNAHKERLQKIIDLRQYKSLTFYNNHFNHIYENKLDGDIVECGVGDGYSLSIILFNLISNKFLDKKKYYGFDSFEGFPAPDINDTSNRNPKKGDWGHANEQFVFDNLKSVGFNNDSLKKIELIKGFFNDTFSDKKSKIEKICLLSLECDLPSSYKISLDTWYDKVVVGGIIVLGGSAYKEFNAVKAIDEFFGERKKYIKRCEISDLYYYIKE